MRIFLHAGALVCIFISCTAVPKSLPILGEMDIAGSDTIFHTIPDFSLVDHHGDTISNATFDEGIYVSDFFFTKCPTICPKMAQQMLRLHEKFKNRPEVRFLSHSIDPKYDTVAALKRYADKLGVGDSKSWYFVCVPKEEINHLANQYLAAAQEDSSAEGGFIHSGHFILVDRKRHIRSYCDGTKPEAVDQLMQDIDLLLRE